jgi:hypothetical protein
LHVLPETISKFYNQDIFLFFQVLKFHAKDEEEVCIEVDPMENDTLYDIASNSVIPNFVHSSLYENSFLVFKLVGTEKVAVESSSTLTSLEILEETSFFLQIIEKKAETVDVVINSQKAAILGDRSSSLIQLRTNIVRKC